MADESNVQNPQESTTVQHAQSTPAEGAQTTSDDSNIKLFGILGYIFPLLFFLPLVMEETKNNEFAKFHANQQLALLIFWLVINAIGIIPILGWLIAIFGWIFGIVLLIMGVLNVVNDKQKQLPLIGGVSLLS